VSAQPSGAAPCKVDIRKREDHERGVTTSPKAIAFVTRLCPCAECARKREDDERERLEDVADANPDGNPEWGLL
jgi:hypothetical protein